MIKKSLFILLCCIFSTALLAAPDNGPLNFDTAAANKRLDHLSLQLSVIDVNADKLQEAISILSELEKKAIECVKIADEQLNVVDSKLNELGLSDTEQIKITEDKQFLKSKKDQLTDKRSQCRLFLLRSEEAINTFRGASSQLVASHRLEVSPNLWENLKSLPSMLKKLEDQFDNKIFYQQIGLSYLTKGKLIGLGLIALLSFAIAWFYRRTIKRKIKAEPAERLADRFIQLIYVLFHRYIIIFGLLCGLALFSTSQALITDFPNYFMWLSYALLVYLSLTFLVKAFIYPSVKSTEEVIPKPIAKPLAFRLRLLATLSLAGLVVYLSFINQPLDIVAAYLARTVFMTLLAINLVGIVWLINRTPKLLYKYKQTHIFLSFILTLTLLIILTTEWLGYLHLANFIIKGLLLTIASTLLVLGTHKLLMWVLDLFSGCDYYWQNMVRTLLGLKKNQLIPEIMWVRFAAFILVWGGYLLSILNIWGLPADKYAHLINGIFHGFKIGAMSFVPINIIAAIFVFALFGMLTRALRRKIAMRAGPQVERGIHNSLAAIAGYIGFSFSLILALMLAGVDFTGLAIIAGALSVGIGFGLQNIVNNFVSGIILLIERPIRVGDRIVVGDIEGYVKKISIRSTIISSLERTDVIIPNAELVSGQVNNLMFGNNYTRVSVFVGVAYGSDANRVGEILREVADAHPEVISEEPNQPRILFVKFADSSLEFEIRCIILDVNRRQFVKSDLHYAIDQAFRENNIHIPFPQRDLHIKNWPGKPQEI